MDEQQLNRSYVGIKNIINESSQKTTINQNQQDNNIGGCNAS